VFILVLLLLEFFLVVEAFCSHKNNFFSQEEIRLKHNGRGVSYLSHGATWLDISLLSPLAALIIAKYSTQWKSHTLLLMIFGVLSMGISSFIHFVPNAKDSIKKPTFVFHDGSITISGWIHLFYTACIMTAVLMLYFASSPKLSFAVLFTVILAVHVAIATIQPAWHLGLKEAFNPIALTIILSAWAALGLGFWWLNFGRKN
jgi:hypothetical protein